MPKTARRPPHPHALPILTHQRERPFLVVPIPYRVDEWRWACEECDTKGTASSDEMGSQIADHFLKCQA